MRRVVVSVSVYSADSGRETQELIYPVPLMNFYRVIGGMFETAKNKNRDQPRLQVWVYEVRSTSFTELPDRTTQYIAREIILVGITPDEGEEITMEQSKLVHAFIEKMMKITYCKRDLDEISGSA